MVFDHYLLILRIRNLSLDMAYGHHVLLLRAERVSLDTSDSEYGERDVIE